MVIVTIGKAGFVFMSSSLLCPGKCGKCGSFSSSGRLKVAAYVIVIRQSPRIHANRSIIRVDAENGWTQMRFSEN